MGRDKQDSLSTLFGNTVGDLVPAKKVFPQLSESAASRYGLIGAVERLPEIPSRLSHLASRNAALLLGALSQILEPVLELKSQFGRERIGVIVGSSTSGIATGEAAIAEFVKTGKLPIDYDYLQQEMGAAAEIISAALEISGPSYMVSTACSSSAKVFSSGRNLLASGLCDAVVVGGADTLCRMTLEGFASLELISSERTNPFSENRKGISIGEGAALFLLTKEEGGVQLLGVGESSDAYHISSPDPSGAGAIAALQSALSDAKISPSDVSYLNLHGTGTPANDAMEALAVSSVFGVSAESGLCLSSTKPFTGHTLGACGAIEAGICWLMLESYLRDRESRLLPLPVHRFDGVYDRQLPPLNLVEKPSSLFLANRAICVSNSFGFGGSNCALVLGAEQ